MTVITVVLGISHLLVLLWLLRGVIVSKEFILNDQANRTQFSIIIPFRNEAKNLLPLIESLGKLRYPAEMYEVFLVNDGSTDASILTIKNAIAQENLDDRSIFLIENVRVTASPKKDAIHTAIQRAKHPWILTTDADVNVPPNWLNYYNSYILENQPKMICGLVEYQCNSSFVEGYQHLDSLSLQGVAIGSMTNGLS